MDNSEKKPKTILLVEDDVFMATLLERKFQQDEFEVLRAASTTQARETIATNNVSIIILDVVLPGKDGITFLQELKKDPACKHIPVIIASNLGQPEEIQKGLDEGAADYIVKANSTPGEIVEKVRSLASKLDNTQPGS